MKRGVNILLSVLLIVFAIYDVYLFTQIIKTYFSVIELLGSSKISQGIYAFIPLVRGILLFIVAGIIYKSEK